jgi:hypothetical protein
MSDAITPSQALDVSLSARHISDKARIGYYLHDHNANSADYHLGQIVPELRKLAAVLGYKISPIDEDRLCDGGFDDAEVARQRQTIDAAGMGGNGFAGAEYAAHVLTVAMRNGGAV